MPSKPLRVWSGTEWIDTATTAPANPITYQSSAPVSPTTGQIWVKSDLNVEAYGATFLQDAFMDPFFTMGT